MSFYAVLPSNACPDTQPKNDGSSYIIDWETPTDLTGKWEVALTEFSFNYVVPTMKRHNKIEYYPIESTIEKVHLIIKNGVFSSIVLNSLINVTLIDNKIHIKCEIVPFTLKFQTIEESNIVGSFTYVTSVSNELIFNYPIETKVDSYVIVDLIYDKVELIEFNNSPKFINIQQMTEYYYKFGNTIFEEFTYDYYGYIYFKIKQEIKSIKLDVQLMYSLGFDDTYTFNNVLGTVFKATKKPAFESAFHQYYIYSSIVDPIMVGGIRVPLLRTVWVGSNHVVGDVIHKNIDHPMYLPVSSEFIKSIEIKIRDDGGNFIDFPYGSKTSMTLHFVYKQNQK